MSQRTASHQTVQLAKGKHSSPAEAVCVMELASMLAGEPFTDRPRAVCPVIGAFLRSFNDAVDDRTRQALYPYASAAVGTRGDPSVRALRVRRLIAEMQLTRVHRRGLAALRRPLATPIDDAQLDQLASRLAGMFWRSRRAGGTDRALRLVDELIAIGSAEPARTRRDPFADSKGNATPSTGPAAMGTAGAAH
jgi:hypothetical protein